MDQERRFSKARVAGSSPAVGTIVQSHKFAGVAQLAVRLVRNKEVVGSTPAIGSIFREDLGWGRSSDG